jgi:hypothetical protein
MIHVNLPFFENIPQLSSSWYLINVWVSSIMLWSLV